MFLGTLVSKVLRHHFSQDCTNTTNVLLFEIKGRSNLFRPWGVRITCFSKDLYRKFLDITIHEIVQTLPKFVYSQ